MIKDHVARSAGVRRRTLLIVVALMTPLAGLGLTSSALAATQPTGEFAVFGQCPRFALEIEDCFYSQATGGVTTINKLTVPIVNPITFQGGIIAVKGRGVPTGFVGALNGETFSVTPEPIPGGMSSLINCNEITGNHHLERAWRHTCKALFENSRFAAKAYETIELARPETEITFDPENDFFEEGTAISLPVKYHLENPLLGRNCYIGSSADPIILNMTTGVTNPPPPNKPITGRYGKLAFNEAFTFLANTDHALLNNEFSTPGATGCGGGFSFIIDSLINSRVGLPSPAGYNTVIHEGFADEASPRSVIASEEEVEVSKEEGEVGKKWHDKWGRWINRSH
jgi:hypothetical protein